jgi:asparagine synthase (glutamine-hydrolysing)
MHDGWTKYIARLAMDGLLPDSIVWEKKKMGWPDPTEYWMNGVLADVVATRTKDKGYASWKSGLDVGRRSLSTDSLRARVRDFNLAAWFATFNRAGNGAEFLRRQA